MKKIKDMISKNQCTGCCACIDICPQNAITVITDIDGFQIPQIAEEMCTHCDRCDKVCPVLHYENDHFIQPEVYAIRAFDTIRMQSSSGGVFSVIAQYILKEHGCCIGAGWDTATTVRHMVVYEQKELGRILGSKYMQSRMDGCMRIVKKLLETGRKVLFVGTPCQIAGLYGFLGKKYINLLTIDLLCHGVPSDQVIETYLQEMFGGGGYQTKIRKIEFRKKKRGWCCSNIDIELDDGFYFGNFDNDWFEKAYHNNLCLRDSCYECKFCTFPRTGDLSIGDFWEADTCEQLKNDAKGTSVVFVNSKLGKTVLDMQRDSFVLFHKIKQEDLYKNRIQANIERHPGRTRFFDLLKKYPFTKSAEYAMQHKYDVVVIGIPTVENHGSNLTYYALYRALKNMGMEVLMAERPLSAQWQPHKVPIGFCKNPYPDQDWCELFQSKYEMQKLNEYAEVFLLGSDQLWYEGLYECFDGFCFLDYIYQNKKKAAYAASFGRDVYSGTSNQRARIQYFLQRFDNISVREQEAVALCQKDFGVETTCVLDPVFLCPSAEYLELIKNAGEQGNTGHKIVTYILDPTQEKEEIVSYIAGRLMLPVIHMTDVINVDEKQDRWTEEFLKNVSNERWLKNIYESDFFITDSFHGTCFGIIFKKQFVAIGNAYRGMARFHTILSKCGLQSRLVLEYDPQQLEQMLYELIDYECVDKKLKPEIEKSRQWLIHAVAEKEQCAVSTYDMLQQQMLQLYHRLMECRDHADAHGNVIGAHDVRMQAYDTAFKNLFQEIAVHQKVLLEQRQTAEALQKVLAEQEEKLERFQNKCLEQEQWIESHQYPLSGFRDKSGTDLL